MTCDKPHYWVEAVQKSGEIWLVLRCEACHTLIVCEPKPVCRL